MKLIWIRSVDPDEVEEKLAAAMLEDRKTGSSMPIVLQTDSTVVFKRMDHKYMRQVSAHS